MDEVMGDEPGFVGLIHFFCRKLGNTPSINELLDLCFVNFGLSWVFNESALCAAKHWHTCFRSGL